MSSEAGGSGDPWWNAEDSAFSGATPLFPDEPTGSDEAPPRENTAEDSTNGADQDPGTEAGSPVMEALRLASALADWSAQSGLTDTLKALAAEAAEALASPAEEPAATPFSQHRPTPQASTEQMSSCEYCPLCRGLDVMRVVQPQVATGLSEAMASMTEALNTAVAAFSARQREQGER